MLHVLLLVLVLIVLRKSRCELIYLLSRLFVQVTRGYMKNPEANAAAFDADGWFRTGDLGHYDADGNLFIVDRLNEIIKYNAIQVTEKDL